MGLLTDSLSLCWHLMKLDVYTGQTDSKHVARRERNSLTYFDGMSRTRRIGIFNQGKLEITESFFDIQRFQIQFSTWLTNATRHMLKKGF